MGLARRFAKLDSFYTSKGHGLDFQLKEYYINGYSVGSDHSPVQTKINIGKVGLRRMSFKWNTSHLSEDLIYELRTHWDRLLDDAFFSVKLRYITRFFRQYSKHWARENKKEELDIKAKLKIASAKLHEDMYNVATQGEVSELSKALENIEIKMRGGSHWVQSQLETSGWQMTAEFFKSIKQKNTKTIISKLKESRGQRYTKREYLEWICHSFYKEAFEEALKEVLEELPTTFTTKMTCNRRSLNNQRPITLLTAIYAAFAKSLQRRLQPVLSDTISPEQTTCLHICFILDNIVFTQETSH